MRRDRSAERFERALERLAAMSQGDGVPARPVAGTPPGPDSGEPSEPRAHPPHEGAPLGTPVSQDQRDPTAGLVFVDDSYGAATPRPGHIPAPSGRGGASGGPRRPAPLPLRVPTPRRERGIAAASRHSGHVVRTVVAVLVLAALAATGATLVGHRATPNGQHGASGRRTGTAARSGTTPASPTGHTRGSSPTTGSTAQAGATSTTTTTTTTTTPAHVGTAPVVASISPSSGSSGTQVVIAGSGFFSADGRIVVTFGGVVTQTRCPDEQSCVATAPARPAGTSVPVVLQTESGSSKPVDFTYR
ncbi:MAG: IPT/TIG domain-containing protein [Acidimicrobiales bacterium]